MLIHTASEGVSFAKEMEDRSAEFYEDIASRFRELRAPILAYADTNRKFAKHIQRVYQEVITDAIEGSYCFKLETTDYEPPIVGKTYQDVHEAVQDAVALEERIVKFYTDAHDQADTLLADLPRAFSMIIMKRKQRIGELRSLLDPITAKKDE